MTCQEAILKALERAGTPLRASEIAEAINSAKTYVRDDGRPLPPYQVYATAYQNDDLFDIAEGLIRVAPRRPAPLSSSPPHQKGHRIIVCSAGAHFVAGELSRQGWIVALASKGIASVDVLARLQQGGRALSIQVKSRTTGSQYAWRLAAPRPTDCDFYVFVDLQENGRRPLYFVVPTPEVVRRWSSQQIRTEDIREFAEGWNRLFVAAERGQDASSPEGRPMESTAAGR